MSSHAILITGANGGIGSATARYFLEKDPSCYVYLGVRSGSDEAQTVAAAFPGRASILKLDVVRQADWDTVLSTVEAERRVITVLVNNAGHHDDQLLANMSLESWSSVIDSNLNSTFIGSRAVLRGMMS